MANTRTPLWLAIGEYPPFQHERYKIPNSLHSLAPALSAATLARLNDFGVSGDRERNDIDNDSSSLAAKWPKDYTSLSVEPTRSQRTAHGILASLAFVVFFPLGTIAMATMRKRWVGPLYGWRGLGIWDAENG